MATAAKLMKKEEKYAVDIPRPQLPEDDVTSQLYDASKNSSIVNPPVSQSYDERESTTPTAHPTNEIAENGNVSADDETVRRIREHIDSFPYCRARIGRILEERKYLGSHLSLPLMYCLYQRYCAEENMIPGDESLYCDIFYREFNIGFQLPYDEICYICFGITEKE